jgi:hypothetical protein
MNRHPRSLWCRAALAAVVCLLVTAPAGAGSVTAAKQKKALPAAPAELKAAAKTDAAPDSAMAMMMKLGQPGPQHEGLQVMAGRWKAVVKSWNAPGEPAVSEGVSENQMILGGRYLEQKVRSVMMNMPFEGHGLTGYDNLTQRYWFSWVDNMGTGLMTGTGTMDDATRTMTLTGTLPGPDGKPSDFRSVTKIVDANRHVFSMYATMGGQEMLVLEITYTRR